MKVLKEEDSRILERKSFVVEIDHHLKATPKEDSIKSGLAKLLKSDEKLMIIKHIYTGFGKGSSKVEVYVYDNEKALKTIEPKSKKKKVAEKKEAPAKVPKAEEKPKEEVKEDGKKAETKEQTTK